VTGSRSAAQRNLGNESPPTNHSRQPRIKAAFAALVVMQAAHSAEEYVGRLWESFPPARFLTGLVAADRALGFLIINGSLVAFGVWCLVWPVRRDWSSAALFVWFWIAIETINAVGHATWTLRAGGYTPGAATAPVLLGLCLFLAVRLRSAHDP
jgi:hypothetical protein